MPTHRWPLWLALAIPSVLVFWTEGPGWPWREDVLGGFGLSREALANGRWWSFLTHGFLHGSWWHALFNLASLWAVGRHLIDEYGSGFFLAILGTGVTGGGLAQVLTTGDGVLIGVSGGVMAMIAAAGFLWDERPVGFGFGRWTIGRVKGKYLGWGVLVAAILFALAAPWMPDGGVAIGHACHAGAALSGAVVAWIARATAPFAGETRRTDSRERPIRPDL